MEGTAKTTGGFRGLFKLPSVRVLVGVNLVPLFLVSFGNWSIFKVLSVYWMESGVIAFYQVFRFVKWDMGGSLPARVVKWLVIPFFLLHFGAFMAGHGYLLVVIFNLDELEAALEQGREMERLWEIVRGCFTLDTVAVLLLLFLSHGFSYVKNYLGRGEYVGKSVSAMMGNPYRRIFVMHMTLMVLGFVLLKYKAIPVFFWWLFSRLWSMCWRTSLNGRGGCNGQQRAAVDSGDGGDARFGVSDGAWVQGCGACGCGVREDEAGD